MPGVFLIRDGRILEAFRHGDVAERPDYRTIVARLEEDVEAGADTATG